MPSKKWYYANKERSAAYSRQYRKLHPEKTRERNKRLRASPGYNEKMRPYKMKSQFKKEFGGNRDVVLKRDGFRCVICGLTRAQNIALYQRDISVDHINRDGNDHRLENLQTLCFTCHLKKDCRQRKLTDAQRQALRDAYINRPNKGKMRQFTYEKLAEQFGVSVATVKHILYKETPNV